MDTPLTSHPVDWALRHGTSVPALPAPRLASQARGSLITRGLLVGRTGWAYGGPGPGAPGLGDPVSVPVSHVGCSPPDPLRSFLCLSSFRLLPVARMDYLEAPGRGLLVVVKSSKPGALGTATNGQRAPSRALLRLLLVFRFQFLALGLQLAVRGGRVENRTSSY